jgi:hypothetical protein
MNLSVINRLIDKYFRRMYGIDVFVTGSLDNMVCNVLLFPDKFLKKGDDYSEEYWNIIAHKEDLIKTLNSFFKMIGLSIRYDRPLSQWVSSDRKKTNNVYNIKYLVSDDLGEYMTGYIDNACKLMSEFVKSDMLPEKFRQKTNGRDYVFTRGNVFFSPKEASFENYTPRLMVDINSNIINDNMFFGWITMGNRPVDEYIREYIYDNMEYDPQISLSIEGID